MLFSFFKRNSPYSSVAGDSSETENAQEPVGRTCCTSFNMSMKNGYPARKGGILIPTVKLAALHLLTSLGMGKEKTRADLDGDLNPGLK